MLLDFALKRTRLNANTTLTLYLSKPKLFKWAGLAAFASRMVGLGIMGGKLIDATVDSSARTEAAKLDQAGLPRPQLPTKRLNSTDLDNMLIAGNKGDLSRHLLAASRLSSRRTRAASRDASHSGCQSDPMRCVD